MGDREKASLRLQFNPQIRLELHGATITSDAGLLAFRELDDALDLTPIASDYLQESRTGRNIRHHLVPLLRQSIYSRLAGYDDTNDAERLSQDPAMRVVVGWQGSDRNAARTNTMSRFETETLTQEDNLKGLALMNPQWVELAMAHTPHRRVILDMDSSESPVHGQQEGAAYNGHFECVCSPHLNPIPDLSGQKLSHFCWLTTALLRLKEDGRLAQGSGTPGQQEAGSEADATDGHRGHLPPTEDHDAGFRTQGVSLPAQRP